MTSIWTIVAILGPWTLGMAMCRRCRCAGWGVVPFGWFVGQALVMFGGYLLIAYCGNSAIKWVSAAGLVLGTAALVFGERHRRTIETPALGASRDAPYTSWTLLERFLLIVLIASLSAKVLSGAISIAWNPGRCEDALAYWLYKAKVVTLLGHVPLDSADPFYLGGSNPKYPIYPSMIAAWIPLVVGEWRESLAVIPWLLTFINLPLAAGAGLPRETPRLVRIVAAYAIASLPLAAVHVFRPGYVDLILASFLMCGLGLLLRWRTSSGTLDLCLAMLMFVAAACTKREGIVAAAVVLGVVTIDVLVRGRAAAWNTRILLPISAAIAGVATYRLMDVSDVASDASHWGYHHEAWAALWRHAVTWSSFSLLFPFAFVAMAGLVVCKRSAEAWLAVGLSIGLVAYAVSPFLLTDNIRFALNDQTPSRLLLQVAPAIVVALAHGYYASTITKPTETSQSALNSNRIGAPCPEHSN